MRGTKTIRISLFDFDGTITKRDTLFEIAKFSTGWMQYCINLIVLLPYLFLVKFKLVTNQRGKEIFLRKFFGGISKEEFNQKCISFTKERLPQLIRPGAQSCINEQLKDGNRVVIVSASPSNWIVPWANKYGIEVISTRLSFHNGRLRGIEGVNCNGQEKVNRIKQAIDLQAYEKVIAYGDTKGDLPMLALADESHFKPFR